jgi:deoxyribodipyrimidine photo-lyase
MNQQPVIHWFRRDLRLSDNLGLKAALESGSLVIPLFIFDPAILKSDRSGAARMAFLLKGLAALDEELQKHGGRLLVRRGEPEHVLTALAAQTQAQAVYFNKDYTPFAHRRDETIGQNLNIPVFSFDDALLLAPGEVMTGAGKPYTVYTPFKKQWRSLPKPDDPSKQSHVSGHFYQLDGLENDGIPDLHDLGFSSTIDLPDAGEHKARHRLEQFTTHAIYEYASSRNRLTSDPFADQPAIGSSYLSPYFRFGMLSPRQAYWAARKAWLENTNSDARQSVETWVDELTWREFYMHIMAHFPHVATGNFKRDYDDLQWRGSEGDFQAWKDGLTGYPIVDAAMRQMNVVGWMPNRARMIVASFLTKDLLINWREGEKYFMQRLIDGDPAANNGGWQWAAGTGTDAQPYFRIFNPVSQSEKFDPDGTYIRRWIPELKYVPDKFVHAPWTMDVAPRDYPPPIVDHAFARERTLNAYKAVKTERED